MPQGPSKPYVPGSIPGGDAIKEFICVIQTIIAFILYAMNVDGMYVLVADVVII